MDVRRQHADSMENQGMPQPARRERGSAGNGMLYTVAAVAVVLVALSAFVWFVNRGVSTLTAGSAIKSKQYQALFLTNGQVYFGKVANIDSSYVKLTDIYYLQVQQTVQPKDNAANNTNNQQVSLAKLGGELHGPEDVMYVSRQQVLFWENLKNDGKVAKAIADYKAGGGK